MSSEFVTAGPEHAAVMQAHETAVVRLMMDADRPDHVHPMMLASIRAAGSMAIQMINSEPDKNNAVLLIDSLEKDCRDMIRVLWNVAGERWPT